uniref:Uncharacterized protein n=1 Tax=Arundo donax TaxID=35708 RepID=A0A0A8YX51_ARUDO
MQSTSIPSPLEQRDLELRRECVGFSGWLRLR